MTLYASAVTIQITDTDTVTIPSLGVFADKAGADEHALLVALAVVAPDAPHLIERPCTVVSVPQSDATATALRTALRPVRGGKKS